MKNPLPDVVISSLVRRKLCFTEMNTVAFFILSTEEGASVCENPV